jgi:hypothetical protein
MKGMAKRKAPAKSPSARARLRTTTLSLAKRAGARALRLNFPGKERLVNSLLEEQLTRQWRALEAEVDRSRGEALAKQLELLIAVAHRQIARNRGGLKILLAQSGDAGRIAAIQKLREQATALLRPLLARHHHEIRSRNLELATFVLVNALIGVLDTIELDAAKKPPQGVREEELARELTRLATGYLGLGATPAK